MTTGVYAVTYSSFAPMSSLGSVHLVVIVIVESIFCCVCLQNPLRETERKKQFIPHL